MSQIFDFQDNKRNYFSQLVTFHYSSADGYKSLTKSRNGGGNRLFKRHNVFQWIQSDAAAATDADARCGYTL